MLKLVTWNMNGLLANKHNLEVLVKTHNPDVIAIQEAGLKNIVKGKLIGYDMKHTTQYIHKHNLITYIRKGTSITHLNSENTYSHPVVSYKLRFKNSKTEHTITNIYVPPTVDIDGEILTEILDQYHNNILLGDLNTNISYSKGRTRSKAIEDLSLYDTNTQKYPTHFINGKTSTIDCILLDRNMQHTHITTETLDGYNSEGQCKEYHIPLMTTISIEANETEKIPYRSSRNMTKKEYQTALRLVMDHEKYPKIQIKNKNEIDNNVNQIEKIINEALDICNPKKIAKSSYHKDYPSDFMKLLVKKKSWAQKKYNKNREKTIGENYRTIRQYLDREIKKLNRDEKKKSYRKAVGKIMEAPKFGRDFWKIANVYSGIKKNTSHSTELK